VLCVWCFFCQAEDGIRGVGVAGEKDSVWKPVKSLGVSE